MGHITNPLEVNEEYTEDNTEFETVAPQYNTGFHVAHKPYEPFVRPTDYAARQRSPNNIIYNNQVRPHTYMTRSREPPIPITSYNDNTEDNEEEQLPQYNFPTEDLKQETYEENDYTNNKPLRNHANTKLRNSIQRNNNVIENPQHVNSLNAQRLFKPPPAYCYQPLNIIHGCIDPKVVGNFWFYNYCTDECMLYATDICDNNRNKFLSLEQCEEHCARPMRNLERFLRHKQAQGCWGAQPTERNFKKRRDY